MKGRTNSLESYRPQVWSIKNIHVRNKNEREVNVTEETEEMYTNKSTREKNEMKSDLSLPD